MEIHVIDATPTPPKLVVISLSVSEACAIHNRLYAVSNSEDRAKNAILQQLIDALTAAHVQTLPK